MSTFSGSGEPIIRVSLCEFCGENVQIHLQAAEEGGVVVQHWQGHHSRVLENGFYICAICSTTMSCHNSPNTSIPRVKTCGSIHCCVVLKAGTPGQLRSSNPRVKTPAPLRKGSNVNRCPLKYLPRLSADKAQKHKNIAQRWHKPIRICWLQSFHSETWNTTPNRVAQLAAGGLRENGELARKWRGNRERAWNWRGNGERMTKWRERENGERFPHFLSVLSSSFHYLFLSPFPLYFFHYFAIFSLSLPFSLSLSISFYPQDESRSMRRLQKEKSKLDFVDA